MGSNLVDWCYQAEKKTGKKDKMLLELSATLDKSSSCKLILEVVFQAIEGINSHYRQFVPSGISFRYKLKTVASI